MAYPFVGLLRWDDVPAFAATATFRRGWCLCSTAQCKQEGVAFLQMDFHAQR